MCDCVEQVNERLKEQRVQLSQRVVWTSNSTLRVGHPMIENEPIDPREKIKGRKVKPVVLFASHCPFCGEKYPE